MQGLTREKLALSRIHTLTPATQQTNLTVSSRIGTTVTAGTANTKGSYTTLITAGSIIRSIILNVSGILNPGTDRGALLDIAYGGSTVVVPNLNVGEAGNHVTGTGNVGEGLLFYLPGLAIPSGQTVDVRFQCVTASQTCTVAIWADANANWGLLNSTYITYGANTGTSQGTSVTPASGTFGSWVNIGTTTRNHEMWIIGYDSLGNINIAAADIFVELGVGPNSGSITSMGFASFHQSSSESIGSRLNFNAYKTTSGDLVWVRIASVNTTPVGITLHAN